MVYTAMLNARGGFESDLTITRLAADTFFILTGSGQAHARCSVDRAPHRRDEFAALVDVTSAYSVISLMGPKSEALLRTLGPDDLSKAALPFSTTAEIDVGHARVRAARMSYVGGPGYEMVVPTDQCATLYDALVREGAAFGLRDAGYYTIDALRIEAGRRAWGAELSPDETPWEAGLGLRGQARQGLRLHRPRRAACASATPACASASRCSRSTIPPRFRGAASRSSMDGRAIGELTSTGYSRTHGRAVAMALCARARRNAEPDRRGDPGCALRGGHRGRNLRCRRTSPCAEGASRTHDRTVHYGHVPAHRPARPLTTTARAAAASPPSRAPPRSQVQSLTRGLSLLEALARAEGGLTLTDLGQRVQLAPSTAHRLLATLEKMGYVYQAGDLGRWYVGLQAFTVGASFLANRDFVAQSHPYMRRLMEQSGETANLGILDGTEAVFIDQVQCRETMRTIVKLGSRVPLHASGVGKAIFAAMPDERDRCDPQGQGPAAHHQQHHHLARDDVGGDPRDPPARLVVRRRGARDRHALRRRADLQRARGGAGRDLARRSRHRACPTSASSSWARWSSHIAEDLTHRLGGRWPHTR